MIRNFEDYTFDLTDDERAALPFVVDSFERYSKANPIKSDMIIKKFNDDRERLGLKVKLTGVRLRKMVNQIRCKGIIPLIATQKGYYVSYDQKEIIKERESLFDRSKAINAAANGLSIFLK